jgi:hypothetical protein
MASIISAGTTSGTALNMAGDTSGILQLATNGSTTALTVNTSQNVGIGTTSPSGKFHVANTGTAGTTADNLSVYFSSTNRNTNVYVQAKNTESSVINFGDGDSLVSGRINYTHSSDYMQFDVNGAERMRINSSGNVGIGTSSPSNKLEVSGDIYANNGDVTGSRYAISQAAVFYNNDKSVTCVTTNVWYNIGFPVTSTSGLFAFRDASRGGSAVFRADTSAGAVSISNGITGFEMQWAGGATGQMQIRVTSGSNVTIKIVCLATNLA